MQKQIEIFGFLFPSDFKFSQFLNLNTNIFNKNIYQNFPNDSKQPKKFGTIL